MGQEIKRKSFVFNIEWQEVLMDYPPEVRLEVYDAIIEYVASGTLSELKPLAKMAFSFIKKQIDYNNDKYDDIVAKRSEAGKKGMANRYQKVTNVTSDNKSNKCYQKVTNVTINDNDNVNDIKKESTNVDKKETSVSSPSTDYLKFNEWMQRKAPYCSNHKNFPSQITESELLKLKEKYSGQEIADIIEQIENRKDLRKRYTNLYRTVLNWAKKEYGK